MMSSNQSSGPAQQETISAPVSKRQRLGDQGGELLPRLQSADEPFAGIDEGIPPATSWPSHSAPCNSSPERMLGLLDKKIPAEGEPVLKLIATRITDYLAPGGTKRFCPRWEWIHPNPSHGCKRPHSFKTLRSSPVPNVAVEEAERRDALVDQPSTFNDGLLPGNAFMEYHARLLQNLADVVDNSSPAIPNVVTEISTQDRATPTSYSFGRDCDSALHLAIREKADEAALELISLGAPVSVENRKLETPLILACQKGSFEVVKALLSRGASVLAVSLTGSTSLLQACHFGHKEIVELLLDHGAMIEMATYKNTTPLMRAAQEGHESVVQLLLRRGARVNRRNNEQMSALMLASQRGHANVVTLLLEAKAEIDFMTVQRSTSLMLACKREHVDVVRVLVSFGCELFIRDSRGRTAADEAARKSRSDLLMLLEPAKQIELMQRRSRTWRNHMIARIWKLLEQERALVRTPNGDVPLRAMPIDEESCFWGLSACESALIRAMTLPEHIVDLVASFMPLPRLWDDRLSLITKRCGVDADAAISCAMDLIDEVLEEGGFLDACHQVNLTPPTHFNTWNEWRSWGFRNNHLDPIPSTSFNRVNALDLMPSAYFARVTNILDQSHLDPHKAGQATPDFSTLVPMNARDWRRGICYLQILAHRSPLLPRALMDPPYNVPRWLIDQLIAVNDIQSLSRRLGSRGAHFETSVAIELVMLASSVVSWYGRERAGARTSFKLQGEDSWKSQINLTVD